MAANAWHLAALPGLVISLYLVILLALSVKGESCSVITRATSGEDFTTLQEKTIAAFRSKCRVEANSGSDEIKLSACRNPLGMESGVISDSALSTSSVGIQGYGKEKARLNSNTAWCTREDIYPNAWIRVDLPASVTVTGLITQGRDYSSAYTTSYGVQYGTGTNWSDVVGNDGSPIVANSDCCTPVTVYFPAPLQLRSFRILPVTWVTTSICIRFELLGCGAI